MAMFYNSFNLILQDITVIEANDYILSQFSNISAIQKIPVEQSNK